MAQALKTPKSVAVVVYPNISMLELTGTYSILNGLKMAKYDVWITAENLEPVASDTPLRVAPHRRFSELPEPEILVVMGGSLPAVQVLGNSGVLKYVQTAAQHASVIMGVGTGSLVLAGSGLLQNRTAATHWAFAGLLELLGARFAREHVVEDGKIITTTGGTGGVDFGLKLVERLAGVTNARLLQLFAEYDPDPPYGGIDWSRIDANTSAHFTQHDLSALERAVSSDPRLLAVVQQWLAGLPVATVTLV